MPTGVGVKANEKGPEKAVDASTVISDANDENEGTFIKGAVTKATFTQIGGEPIYTFNIQFVPIDFII